MLQSVLHEATVFDTGSLRRHFMSVHLNVKNHVCGLCGKSFYRKEYLTGHLIQHGGAVAEGLVSRKTRTTYKPRPSVFNHEGKQEVLCQQSIVIRQPVSVREGDGKTDLLDHQVT